MNKELSDMLFKTKGSAFGISCGDRSNDATNFSQARGSVNGAVVISSALLAIEILEAAQCVVNDNEILFRTDDDTLLSFDGETMHACDDKISKSKFVACIISWATKDIVDNETASILQSIFEEYRSSGSVETNKLYRFCDAFYYEHAKQIEKCDKICDLTKETTEHFFNTLSTTSSHPIIKTKVSVTSNGKEEDNATDTTTDNSNQKFLEDCKNGKYLIPYKFDAKVAHFIIPISALDDFSPNEEFVELVESFYSELSKTIEELDAHICNLTEALSRVPRVMLSGVPGTGKTRVLMAVATALGIPFASVPVNQYTETDTFCGMTAIEDGKLVYQPTDFLLIHRYGGMAVVEESNLLPPNLAQGILGQEIEAPYILPEFGSQTTERHPLSVIAFTMNPDTIGSTQLNQAFASRSDTIIVMDNPDKKAFINNTMAKYGKRWTKKQISFAYDIMKKTQSFLCQKDVNAEEISEAITPRLAVGFLKHCEKVSVEKALNKSFYGMISLYNRDIANRFQSVLENTVTLEWPVGNKGGKN